MEITGTNLLQEPGIHAMVSVFHDITERKQAEMNMRESEARFRAIFNSTFQFIGLLDKEGTLLEANETALAFGNLQSQDVLNRPFWETAWWRGDEERVAQLRDAVRRAATGEFVRYTVDVQGSKANETIDFSIKPVFDEYGHVSLLVPEGRVITEQKRIQEALRESERKLRAIFDHHYQLTGMLDCEGRLLAANRTALDFVGAGESEVLGQYFWDSPWWDTSQRTTVRDAIQRAAQGEFVRFECTHIGADGAIRNFDFSLSPVCDDEENVMYLVPEGRDITELKKAERQLHEHDAMIRDIVETSRDWIWAIDLQGIHTYCNPAVEAILGYRPDELVGKSSLDLIHEEDRTIVLSLLPESLAARRGWNGLVLRWRHKNGGWRNLESNAVPVVGPGGDVLGFRGVDRDITSRLEAEEKMARMEAHVARLSVMGEMAAGIAHEIGQPLYAIGNLARATSNAIEAEGQPSLSDLREWNAAIVKSAERATVIFKRMRTFARRDDSDRSTCCINEIVRESVQMVSFEARSCGAKVQLDLSEPSPRIHVDRVQIQQVVVNLLRNAFEAMGESEAETRDIDILVEPAMESIRVSVTDTGPGLSTPRTTEIFEPFSTTKKNGLGLGLAISTSIIEAHGGELSAESVKTGGASFRFTIPALPVDSDPADA